MNIQDYETENARLFVRLKQLNEEDVPDESIFDLVKSYEELRASYRESVKGTFKYDDDGFLLKTGHALTNCTVKLLSLPSVKAFNELKNNSSESKRCIVFFATRGGLCNRLRAIVSLKIIARFLGIPFYFIWLENPSCQGGISNLCSVESHINVIDFVNMIKSQSYDIYAESAPDAEWLFYDKYRTIANLGSWSDFKELYSKEARKFLDELISNQGLAGFLEEFVQKKQLGDFLGVHIRRTDFVKYYKQTYPDKALPSIEDYKDKIYKERSSDKFFISTDEVGVIDELDVYFGDSLCFVNVGEFNTKNLRQTSFKHSLLDLSVLSRAKKLIITPGSSFSSYAASVANMEIIEF